MNIFSIIIPFFLGHRGIFSFDVEGTSRWSSIDRTVSCVIVMYIEN